MIKNSILKPIFILSVLLATTTLLKAQKVDSIYFNLYTDSLKKGTFNYINVDGKFSDGKYLPMTVKEITLTASAGKFDGNSLFIDSNFKEEKVTVKAVLKSNPQVWKEVVIYIKKKESTERLKTEKEILQELDDNRKKQKQKNFKET